MIRRGNGVGGAPHTFQCFERVQAWDVRCFITGHKTGFTDTGLACWNEQKLQLPPRIRRDLTSPANYWSEEAKTDPRGCHRVDHELAEGRNQFVRVPVLVIDQSFNTASRHRSSYRSHVPYSIG